MGSKEKGGGQVRLQADKFPFRARWEPGGSRLLGLQ